MTSLARFIRQAYPSDLQQHLEQLELETSRIDWHGSTDHLVASIVNEIAELAADQQEKLQSVVDRICAMTDEIGQVALLSLPTWKDGLELIDGACARSHWLFLQSEDAFRQAEEIRYADENQNAAKTWDSFAGPRLMPVKDDVDSVEAFKEAVAFELDARRLHIEPFERMRHRAGEPDRSLIQVTIYNEGLPEDELVFVAGTVQNRPRRRVLEHVLIYEPETGTIEVITGSKETRAEIASHFAEILLGVEINGGTLPRRRYELSPLLRPGPLAVDPAIGIAKAKLTKIALSTLDNTMVQRFEVPFKDEGTLHEVLQAAYGDQHPFHSPLRPFSARIDVFFAPTERQRRGKKINAEITLPNRCNVRGKTAQERVVLNQCLKAWGLERGAEA